MHALVILFNFSVSLKVIQILGQLSYLHIILWLFLFYLLFILCLPCFMILSCSNYTSVFSLSDVQYIDCVQNLEINNR